MNNSNNFKQPEALRLADALEDDLHTNDGRSLGLYSQGIADNAAAELRRLYAEVDSLSYRLAYPDNFLKEPEQEPVAWMFEDDEDNGHKTFQQTPPSSEAVAYLAKWKRPAWVPLYTSPQARKPLTDEELYKVFPAIATYTEANKTLYRSIARAIEAAHGIKEKHE